MVEISRICWQQSRLLIKNESCLRQLNIRVGMNDNNLGENGKSDVIQLNAR